MILPVLSSIKKNSFQYGYSILILLVMSCTMACRDTSESAKNNQKYSLHILDKDGKEYIVTVNDLEKGIIKPEELTEALPDSISRNMIVKDGYYYQLQRKSGTLNKYSLKEHQLVQQSQIQLKDYGEENFIWIGKDTLLLSGLNNKLNTAKYYIVNTQKMTIIQRGFLPINKPTGKFNTTSIGFVLKRKDTILVGYTFHATTGPATYTTSDTMYVTKLGYPNMNNLGIQKETRSTYPAGVNSIQHNEFTDENGDFYFMSCPGIAMGNRPDLPTAIFRIKSNSSQIDHQYFFNLSSAIHNHAYGLWYVGDGKAIVRAERKDLYTGLSDHYSVAHFEFYLIALRSQKIIKKLDLPLDKGTRKECVLVKGNIVYIAVNSSKEGNYIWRYNLKTGQLTKGLQLAGITDFIVRLDVLN